MLRTIYDDKRGSGGKEDQQFTRNMNEMTQFVRAGRLHGVSSRSVETEKLRGLLADRDPFRSISSLHQYTSFPTTTLLQNLPVPFGSKSRLLLSKELLIRYNPLQGLSTEDRVTATAKRVGLSSPTGYIKGQEFGRGWALKDEGGEEGER